MISVLMTRPFKQEHADALGGICDLTYSYQATEEQLRSAEVILGELTLDQLAKCENLKWIQSVNAGTDRYTQQPGFPEGVILTTSSGAFGKSIAEYVLTMTMMLMKKMHLYRDNQAAHLWRDEGEEFSPSGKHILVLGAGDIGRWVARLFKPFGCTVTGVRRVVREVPEEFDAMVTLEEAEGILPQADVVVCALPNTAATRGWFNEARLSLLKESAYLVNVGRGNFIDCQALARRLAEGKLAGAALDVTNPEPLPEDHPLWSQPNAIITPHISGGSFGHLKENVEIIMGICRENIGRWERGEALLNQVDFSTGYRVTQP